jgi:hypothetical protein
MHARDYMVYAYLQSGRDEAARQVIAEAQQFAGAESASPAGPFALAAMPARFAMERGAWRRRPTWRRSRANSPLPMR